MSDLEQQLPAIERLRAERDGLGQQAYALRTKIARTSAALRASRVDAGRRSAPPAAVISEGRAEIARHEVRLRELAAAEQDARRRIVLHEHSRQRQEFLDRSLAALGAAADEIRMRLRQEQDVRPRDRKKLGEIQTALERTEAQMADARRSLEELHAGDAQREADSEAAREQLGRTAAESRRLRERIDHEEEHIGALHDATGPGAAQLEDHLAELNERYAETKGLLKASRANLHERIKGIYVNPHPRDTVAQMSDSTPFVLLPMRIETRFKVQRNGGGSGPELLLRIYPDDIAVHTHESDLSDREVTEGERYWRTIFDIEKGPAINRATLKTESWKVFAALFGPSRAAWVARRTRPTNWVDPLTIVSADALTFPPHDLTRTAAWTRAPRTQVMPDRFVVRLYRNNTVTEVVGEPIPDELFVGPEPLDLVAEADQEESDVEDSFVTVDGQLTFGANFDWTSNFDRAIEQGMGFRIPLDAATATQGFDRIVVLGVMASAGPGASKGILETLLTSHHHSPQGLTLLRQGTATNNMDGQGSGYSINDSLDQVGEVTGIDKPLFTATSDVDGRVLADALGVSHDTLHFVFNADNTDGREAVAMNRALYPATLGYYFDTLLPVMSPEARDRLRDFFVNNVTGRGPLSSIRVGDQPYGILVTSDFAKWGSEAQRDIVLRRDPFPDVLLAVLRRFDAIWQAILPKLVFAGKPGISTSEALINVLGLQAGSASFTQRIGYSAEYLKNLADFQFGGGEFDELVDAAVKELFVIDWLRTLGYEPPGPTSSDRPQLLRLIYQHYTTGIDAANLVDAVPLSENATIREFTSGKNYIDWLRDAASLNALASQDFGGAPVPTALLYLKLRHALLLQLHKTTVDWLKNRGYDASITMAPRTFHNIRPEGDLSRWELMSAPVTAVGASRVAGKLAIADYVLSPSVVIDEAAYLQQMRAALETLSNLSTARLERCFTEHIDTCTYRLDAWQTGLFKTRLDAMRRTERGKLGAYIGAFGWVENARPSTSWLAVTDVPERLKSSRGAPLREYAGNGGFIHAPSINHATAAALLRSGYMSHATTENPDVFSVNVSSERVRRALFILQGMRNGQSIEALLGYQFERGIHDRASVDPTLGVLNGFIFDIRVAFPIKRVRVGAGEFAGVEETVEAYDVVNGVTLVETANPDWAAITGAPAATLTAARIDALNEEREKAADTLDAIKDLLLSESAYQLVQGNFDRAGAVLGSMKDAHPPPDLDVIKTPRSSHFTFTQRVAVHFPRLDATDPSATAWPAIPMTPRAVLEPGVNRWLGDVIGSPDAIVFTAFEVRDEEVLVNPQLMSVEDLALQPIDLVYIIGADINTGAGARSGASELESRVAWRYRADNGLDETSRIRIQFGAPASQAGTVTMAEVMPLMRALQSVLSDSRPLDARDYHTATTRGAGSTGPAATPAAGFNFADLRARAEGLQSQLGAVIDELHAIPFTAIIGGWPVADLEGAFRELRANEGKVELSSVFFDFTVGDALTLQLLLIRLSAFGLTDAFPRVQNVTTDDAKVGLVSQAKDAAGAAVARKAASERLLADAVTAAAASDDRAITLAVDACKAILGGDFAVIPGFGLPNEAEVLQSNNGHAQLMSHAVNVLGMRSPEEEWLRSVAYVRPRVAAWERIRLLHETLLRNRLDITAVQLPYRNGDSWLAVTLPETDAVTGKPFDIAHDTLSMIVHGDSAFAPGSLRYGIMIDSWTETIPAREQSTGIAFHYNRPDAMPPQTLLLAVPPSMTGHWSWDALASIVDDTLRRAKLRAVEPHLLDEHVQNPELGVLLPAVISEFQQYDLNVSLDLRMNLVTLAPFLAEMYVNPNLNA